jgi:hypothetical protein
MFGWTSKSSGSIWELVSQDNKLLQTIYNVNKIKIIRLLQNKLITNMEVLTPPSS